MKSQVKLYVQLILEQSHNPPSEPRQCKYFSFIIHHFRTILVLGNFDSDLIETAKFTCCQSATDWIKGEDEFEKVKYLYIAEQSPSQSIVQEVSPKKEEIEEEIKEDLIKKDQLADLRKSDYLDGSLDLADIDLKIKEEERKTVETLIEKAQFGSLTKSDTFEEESQKTQHIRDILKEVELPERIKITQEELEHDIFTIMIRPPVLRYVACAFFAIATIGSIIF